MRLLVIGGSNSAEVLADALRQPNEVDFVQSADELWDHTRDADKYDWVFVDDADACVANFAEMTMREQKSSTPVSRMSTTQDESDAKRRPMPICAVETTGEGMQILRCALRHAVQSPDGDPALKAAVGERPLAFEYHAPIRKTG